MFVQIACFEETTLDYEEYHLQGRRKWRRYVPPKRRLQLNRLHGVISQKMILFITTAVKTPNPTTLD
jgi:hypothetical protein